MSDWSVRRVHQVAELTGATTYLEVGVYGGDTFFPIGLPYKDAVDPAFRFNSTGMSTAQTRFFQMPSDEFFASALPRPQYDIIFLDGLHTFAQTFRDFVATLPLSHPRTVWLIDDTVPCDPYSALPDMDHSYRERAKARVPGNPWHGDVYKVIYALHDYFPNLNFATILDGGNPQTLVWREPRQGFHTLFGSWEAIERSGFFDMDRYAAAMRYTQEADAMARLQSYFAGPSPADAQPIFAP